MRRIAAALVIGLAFAADCASAGGTKKSDCTLRPIDSTFAGKTPVYRDCAVDTRVKLLTDRVNPDYRPQENTPRSSCNSAEVIFVVDTLGHAETATAKILRATNADFGAAVITMLSRLHYEPALLNGERVRQITTERRALSSVTVLMPAGSGPPSAAQMRGQVPKC